MKSSAFLEDDATAKRDWNLWIIVRVCGRKTGRSVMAKKITKNINKSEKPCYDVLADSPV
jgi:hypothetical protein